MPLRFARYARKFAMPARKNAKNIHITWIIAENAQRHAAGVLKNAGQWQGHTLSFIILLIKEEKPLKRAFPFYKCE